jgi:hypothetical protein
MLSVFYAECLLCYVSFMLTVFYANCLLCWVSFILSVLYAKCLLCWQSFMLSVFYAECLLCWQSFMLSVFYAECLLCWVSQLSPLSVEMLSGIILNVVKLNVVAPMQCPASACLLSLYVYYTMSMPDWNTRIGHFLLETNAPAYFCGRWKKKFNSIGPRFP